MLSHRPTLADRTHKSPTFSGHRAESDLYEWVFATEHPQTTDSRLRQILDIRDLLLKRLQDGGWIMFKSEINSAADCAGMDYILLNTKDGRYFIFDATLALRNKRHVADLRAAGVIELHTQFDENDQMQLHEFYIMRFMRKLLDVIDNGHTPLNMRDTAFPDTRTQKDFACLYKELAQFLDRIRNRCSALKEKIAAHAAGTDVKRLREDLELLDEYMEDLHKAATCIKALSARSHDPQFEAHLKMLTRNAKTIAMRIIREIREGRQPREYTKILTRTLTSKNGSMLYFGSWPSFEINLDSVIAGAVARVLGTNLRLDEAKNLRFGANRTKIVHELCARLREHREEWLIYGRLPTDEPEKPLFELEREYLRRLSMGQIIHGVVVDHVFARAGHERGLVVRVNEYVTAFVPRTLASLDHTKGLVEQFPIGSPIAGRVLDIIFDGNQRKRAGKKTNVAKVTKRLLQAKGRDVRNIELSDETNLTLDTRNSLSFINSIHLKEGDIVSCTVVGVASTESPTRKTHYNHKLLVVTSSSLQGSIFCGHLGTRRVADLHKRLPPGSQLQAQIRKVLPNGRLELDPTPEKEKWMARLLAAKEADEAVDATVIECARYGVFVTFGGVIDALLHENNFRRLSDSGNREKLNLGQKLKVKMIHVVAGDYKRISVTRKNVAD